MKVLVINGPNLDMLGKRDPAIYGADTLDAIRAETDASVHGQGIETEWFQSNAEGEIVEKLHAALGDADAVVINAGALTHYSLAIHDALEILSVPKIELHISNVYAREAYRRHSVIGEACTGVVAGLGKRGYRYAILAAAEMAQ